MLPLSIAIPTWNRRELLARAIDSVLQDPSDGFELIVSDNASDDGTEELLCALTDPRVRVFRHEKNVGMRANWRHCVDMARGSRILILSDDDYVAPRFAEAVLAQRRELEKASLAFTGCRIVRDGSISGPLEPGAGEQTRFGASEFLLAVLAGHAHIHLCSVLFDRARLAEKGFSQAMQYALDMDAWIDQVAEQGVLAVPDATAFYQVHPGCISNAISATARYQEELLITKKLTSRLSGAVPEWRLRLLAARRNCSKAAHLGGASGRRGIRRGVGAARLMVGAALRGADGPGEPGRNET